MFSELYDSVDSIKNIDLATLRKKTYYYKLLKDDMTFKSIDNDKPDLPISELEYKGLVRFKQLIEKYESNNKPDFSIFFRQKFD